MSSKEAELLAAAIAAHAAAMNAKRATPEPYTDAAEEQGETSKGTKE